MCLTQIVRSLQEAVEKDLQKKIVIIAGPRQCGKTTLAKSLGQSIEYLNYDNLDDRAQILAREWDRKREILVFDELHKMPKWKAWLKGVYDKELKAGPAILVTGSARLNAFRKTGDSLAGRHFYYRLHPFDLKEVVVSSRMSAEEAFARLMTVGGYPEPFLLGDEREYRRWRQTHLDIILRQDLADFELVKDLRSLELLIQLLRTRVGSPVSANSLAVELQKDPKTIQRWLEILEDLFVIFRVTPYFKDIARSLKKEPKFYFYDTGFVQGHESQKLENLVACSLLKECHYQTDAKGRPFFLHYLRVKDGKELDFVLIPEEKSDKTLLLEVKKGDSDVSPQFKLFAPHFKNCRKVQLVQNLKREFSTAEGVEVQKASSWLSNFDLTD